MTRLSNIAERFRARFDGVPRVYRAPGRVNLIGEHTDYNDGYAMPVAIDFDTYAACAETNSGKLSIQSLQEPGAAEFTTNESTPIPLHNWTDYVRGVSIELEREGRPLRGANLLIFGKVPLRVG